MYAVNSHISGVLPLGVAIGCCQIEVGYSNPPPSTCFFFSMLPPMFIIHPLYYTWMMDHLSLN